VWCKTCCFVRSPIRSRKTWLRSGTPTRRRCLERDCRRAITPTGGSERKAFRKWALMQTCPTGSISQAKAKLDASWLDMRVRLFFQRTNAKHGKKRRTRISNQDASSLAFACEIEPVGHVCKRQSG